MRRITPCPSANHGERRDGAAVSLVVLHYTGMPTAAAALARLCAPEPQVSAHYLIDPRGEVFGLVAEGRRAWHAGTGAWGAVTDVNSASIGIELANPGDAPFAAPQMLALEELLADILGRHGLGPERVIGHSDCAPGRKVDPGPRFDWRRLARSGLSVWPWSAAPTAPGTPDPAAFAAALRAFGYTAEVPAETLLQAFRLRFRPGAEGPLAPADMAAARALAGGWPVDLASRSA